MSLDIIGAILVYHYKIILMNFFCLEHQHGCHNDPLGHSILYTPPPLLTSFSEGARKVVSEGLMRPLPLIFAALSEGFEEKFVFFCGGKEKSVNF